MMRFKPQFRLRSLFYLTLAVALALPCWPRRIVSVVSRTSNVKRAVWVFMRWPHLSGCEVIGWIQEGHGSYVAIWPHPSTPRSVPYALIRERDGTWTWQDTRGHQTLLKASSRRSD